MKKSLVVAACALLMSGTLVAQDYKGKGRQNGAVFDQDGKPLEGVRVKLFCVKAEGGYEVKTDKDGRWLGAWMRSGTWNVDFEKAGYAPVKKSLEITEAGKNPDIKITMQKVEGLVATDELKAGLVSANQLFDQKNYPAAIDAYNALLAKFPDAYILWQNVGNCFFAQEQYDKAVEAFARVLEKDPNNREATLLTGNCYANLGDKDKAMEWYGKIQFEKISDPTVLYNIGSNFYNLSKFEDALKYYQRAVDINKDFLDGLYQLGLTYTTLTRTPEAVAVFERYLKLDPDSPRAGQVKGFLDYLRKK
jgi:tetratricopeptide (TPR) repeat protein